jgi:hypothetical protein
MTNSNSNIKIQTSNIIITIQDTIHNYYRQLVCLLNISLIIPLVIMILLGYESFHTTILYQSFIKSNINNGTLLSSVCILFVSIPIIIEILYDILFIRKMKLYYDHRIYDILQFKLYLMIGYVIPAIFICSYHKNPKIQAIIYIIITICISICSINMWYTKECIYISIYSIMFIYILFSGCFYNTTQFISINTK